MWKRLHCFYLQHCLPAGSQCSLKNYFVTCAGLELFSHSLSCNYEEWGEQGFYHLWSDGDTWVSDELSIELTSPQPCAATATSSVQAVPCESGQANITDWKQKLWKFHPSSQIISIFLCPILAGLSPYESWDQGLYLLPPRTPNSFKFLQIQIPSNSHGRQFWLVTYLPPFSINALLLHYSILWNYLAKTGNYRENLEDLMFLLAFMLKSCIIRCHNFRFKLPPSFCFYVGCKCCFSTTPDKRNSRRNAIFWNGNLKK